MDADEQRQLREDAQLASDSLKRLMQLQTKVDEHLTQIKQRTEFANHSTVASTRELRVQLSLLTAQFNAAATQLSTLEPLLATAAESLMPTTAEPPAEEAPVDTVDEQPQAAIAEKSYRLIYQSGRPPITDRPARLRLSRDELSKMFGHLQPWELARHRRPLGTPLFHQSVANYTKLVIDCEDDTARRMWAAMPLAVAHRWGKRATNVREIKHRYPKWREGWCRGTWVAVVEGHAIGRAAIWEKKVRQREGTAGDDGDGQPAHEGTLEVLSFEAVELGASIDIPRPPPSSDLPPAPDGLIHLPALTTVDNIPGECMAARVGRQWRTPAIKTLVTRGRFGAASEVQGGRAWLADCGAIVEVLDLEAISQPDGAASVLSALPADGQSLAALRTLRCLPLRSSPAGIDRLREVMVARGARRSIRELEIYLGEYLLGDTDDWEILLQKAAQLVAAVSHREALSQPIVRQGGSGDREIAAETLSRTSSSTPTLQRIVHDFAKTADIVVYGGDEAHRVAITNDTFPTAIKLRLTRDALANEAKQERAIEIASHMPSLWWIEAGDAEIEAVLDAPTGEVWTFLERLQTVLIREGRERCLAVDLCLPANAFADDDQSPCL